MNKTKIEWCDSTWNPVTGCLNGCEYCYARGMARRFEGEQVLDEYGNTPQFIDEIMALEKIVMDKPVYKRQKDGKLVKNPYPFGFKPTFHRYRLNEYANKSSRTVFVGSMTDLFGEWVPDEWICDVFKACEAAPQHRYLFLTKNPKRYAFRYLPGDNMWYGATITTRDDLWMGDYMLVRAHRFFSIEPLLEDICSALGTAIRPEWVIIGAETGNRKNKVVPKREWVEAIIEQCRAWDIPVFMKNSLADVWGELLVQQFPWEGQI
jgi:protein gp37